MTTGTCKNCGRPDATLRVKECSACYSYRYNHGVARDATFEPDPKQDKQLAAISKKVQREATWRTVVVLVGMANEVAREGKRQ